MTGLPSGNPIGSAPGEAPRVAIQSSRGNLLATLPADLGAAVLGRFQIDVLERIRATGARGLVIDLSGVEVLDAVDFEWIRRSAAMAQLMGVTVVVSGIQAGVAAAVVDLGFDTEALCTAHALDDALELLAAELGDRRDAEAAVETGVEANARTEDEDERPDGQSDPRPGRA